MRAIKSWGTVALAVELGTLSARKNAAAELRESLRVPIISLKCTYWGSDGPAFDAGCRHVVVRDILHSDVDHPNVLDALRALHNGTICGSLHSLDVSNTNLGPLGLKTIVRVLSSPSCSNIRTLYIAENHIEDEGARIIASALVGNGRLTSISLASNGVGVQGALAIAEALKRNTVLKVYCTSPTCHTAFIT